MALTSTEEALVRQLLDQQAAILSLAGNESTITSKLGATKVTLSDLVAASAVADSDLLLLRQGTSDKSATAAVIKAAMTPADASTTVKGVVELATDGETQTGTDAIRAVTPASLRSDRITAAGDPTFADNSTKAASTGWVRDAMSAIAIAAGFAASFTTNGYIKFPSWLGGFILQWGSGDAGSAGPTVTFPIAFTTACYAVICGDIGNTPTGQCAFAPSTTSFRWYAAVTSDAGNWIAVGK